MTREAIAIVGMACRYPDATSPSELLQNVLARRRAFRRIPECRLPASYLGAREDPDRAYVTHAGVLRDWEFDRQRFGVPGPLHRSVDHTHWLALETAANALSDAGHPNGDGLDRDTVGVVLGNSLTGEFTRASTLRLRWPFIAAAAATAMRDAGASTELAGAALSRLERLVKQPFSVPGDEMLAGALSNTIAGRICNHFDFHGTGYTVDGACSSSLLAVMTACRALATRELDFALAGGVDMSLDPFELVGFSRLGALASGEMRVYDANPTGFLPGEGCGVIALMRAEDAKRLEMRTYAHIVGWASSSDGAGGLTRPHPAGQALALRRAYRMAELNPGALGLIEGHGTGTAVGDRVELEALSEVRGHADEPAALGTIKANIGHTKAAAGLAGLIKATLATHHRVLPPTTGCEEPNPLLDKASAPLRVLAEPEQWNDPTPRAGVSSMGFGGINVHIVIEGAGAPRPKQVLSTAVRQWSAPAGAHEIVLIGTPSTGALADRLAALAKTAHALSHAEIRDVAVTEWQHGSSRNARYRAALVARTPEELAAAAHAAAQAAANWDGALRIDQRHGYALGSELPPRVGLLFPGQAAPVRTTLAWWTKRLDIPSLSADLVDRVADVDTAMAQPAIVRQSLAGLAWLRELECVPVAALGHSLGEITALHWAGAYPARVALELAHERGRIMAKYGAARTTMVSLAASAEVATDLLDGTDAVVAGYNAPGMTTVSGTHRDIAVVVDRATKSGMHASLLPVSHGFHSPAMSQAADPMRRALMGFPITAPERPVISTVTGEELSATGEDLRELLVGQLTSPVRFTAAITALAHRCDLLIETGPGTILTGLAEANPIAIPTVSMDCGGDPRQHAFVTAVLAACSAADIEPWFVNRPYRVLSLDAEPRFVVNPCENRTGWADAPELPVSLPHKEAPVGAQSAAVTADPLGALVAHLSATLELPAATITSTSSLLSDLHLSSLQAVQAVATVAAAMRKQPPDIPLSLTDATVGQAAEMLRSLPIANTETAAPAPGVRGWVRVFEPHWELFSPGHSPDIHWMVDAPAGHWLHEQAMSGTQAVNGLAVALNDDTPAQIADLLRRVAELRPDNLLIVHNGHPAATGVARSVVMEYERCSVTVVELPDENRRVDLSTLADAKASRYLELRATGKGSLERATVHARTPHRSTETTVFPLDSGDVCLVTGGVRGITAYAAETLATRTGCTLVFLGRTPADDPDVATALSNLGITDAHYLSCDITNDSAVHDMVASARHHGTIRGLVHGAGVNEPRRMHDITQATFQRTLGPKVAGLKALLGSVGGGLRLVVGFGSIVGRQGLAGQAEYCIANDWLRIELERWAAANPHCRTQHVEWSAWSGRGMGVRLEVLDSLRRRGIEPIDPQDGSEALLDLLADPEAPVTVLIASRFPATATLTVPGTAKPWLRFGERPRVHTLGVEVVMEADLSLGSDPYLGDHRIDGMPVLPAVVGLEAMVQAAAVTGCNGNGWGWSMSDVEFRSPVTVDRRDGRTIQAAALTGDDGVEVVLRDDSDRFSSDRFVARVTRDPDPVANLEPLTPPAPRPSVPQPHPLYGSLLFHGQRFQRLIDYDSLSAFRVSAWINADDNAAWFSEFHNQELLLGDPGAHDATLHTLLACLPHRRALPIGADRITLWRKPSGTLRVQAREINHTVDTYEFDVDLVQGDGVLTAAWRGLRLRAVGPIQWRAGMPRRLVGPWLSRRLIECGLADGVELVTTTGSRQAETAALTVSRLTGGNAWFDPSGTLHVEGHATSVSHTGENLLLALAETPVGVDWALVPKHQGHSWSTELGALDRQTAENLVDSMGEDDAVAPARLLTARAALAKLGGEPPQQLRVEDITKDGLAVARAGSTQVVTAKIRMVESDSVVVAAIATQVEC